MRKAAAHLFEIFARRGPRTPRRAASAQGAPEQGRYPSGELGRLPLRFTLGNPGRHSVVIVGEVIFGYVIGGGVPNAVMTENVPQRFIEMLGGIRSSDIVRMQ